MVSAPGSAVAMIGSGNGNGEDAQVGAFGLLDEAVEGGVKPALAVPPAARMAGMAQEYLGDAALPRQPQDSGDKITRFDAHQFSAGSPGGGKVFGKGGRRRAARAGDMQGEQLAVEPFGVALSAGDEGGGGRVGEAEQDALLRAPGGLDAMV